MFKEIWQKGCGDKEVFCALRIQWLLFFCCHDVKRDRKLTPSLLKSSLPFMMDHESLLLLPHVPIFI
jgi:hypothetical protein